MKIITRALQASVAGAGLVLLTPTAAMAGTSVTVSTSGSDPDRPNGTLGAAYGSFFHDTEVTRANDNCADGHSAVLRYKVGSGSTVFKVWASGGVGTLSQTANSIAEGTPVHISACVGR